MSRPLIDIANEACGDIEALKEALDDARALFLGIREILKSDSAARELAQLGVKHMDQWHRFAGDWLGSLETDLAAIEWGAVQ